MRSGLPEKPTGSFDNDWVPRDYLEEFYIDRVVADEQLAVRYQIELLRRLTQVGQHPISCMLEFGCGPTMHRAIAAAPYVTELHLADYLDSNLKEIERWLDNEPTSFNWNHYTRYILTLEGNVPTADAISQREYETRKKVTRLIQANAGNKQPLGKEGKGTYPVVLSYFCADSATGDKKIWERYMRNIASLVKPGGVFTVAALAECFAYRTREQYFPSANVTLEDIIRVLSIDFDRETIYSELCHLPEHAEQGYVGILLANANK